MLVKLVTSRLRATRPRRLAWLALAASLGLLAGGCESFDSPQNTFSTSGDVAEDQRYLFFFVMWPALVVMVLVGAAMLYILFRFRRRSEQEPAPKQVHGNTKLELAWTIAPAFLLIAIAVPTLDGIIDLGRAPHDDALRVNVIGQQWLWSFEYPELVDASGQPLRIDGRPGETTELHIPIDREIGVTMESNDVIHSFWVPKLAGKEDVVPGHINEMWFNATEPGTFAGQCVEFCGLDHAIMTLRVVAETPEEFDAWVDEQLAAAAAEAPVTGTR